MKQQVNEITERSETVAEDGLMTDLEPHDEVTGGGGARISKVVVDNHNPNTTYSGTTVKSRGTLQLRGDLVVAGEGLGL